MIVTTPQLVRSFHPAPFHSHPTIQYVHVQFKSMSTCVHVEAKMQQQQYPTSSKLELLVFCLQFPEVLHLSIPYVVAIQVTPKPIILVRDGINRR